MPLTGDASDRRYFRILLADGESIVLALHAGPIEFATLPFANVARAAAADAAAGRRRSSATPMRLGILALEDLGDVTLQAHLGAASASRARRALPRGGRA